MYTPQTWNHESFPVCFFFLIKKITLIVCIFKMSLKYMESSLGPAHWSVFAGNFGCFLFSVIINSSARKVFVHKSMSASDYFLREDSWKGNYGELRPHK